MSEKKRPAPYVVVIGGANVDVVGKSYAPLIAEESNLGSIHLSPGGVGRNIAENISHMNVETYLIAPLGNDDSRQILLRGNHPSLHLEYCPVLPKRRTGSYFVLLDENGEMCYAINDMEIMEEMSEELLEPFEKFIHQASTLVLDANLPEKTLSYLLGQDLPFTIVDGVSGIKVLKIRNHLHQIDLLKVNHLEAGVLVENSLSSKRDIIQGGKILLEKGAHELIITAGAMGSFYFKDKDICHFQGSSLEVENASGAGDSFTAILAYGHFHHLDRIETICLATAASRVVLQSEHNALQSKKELLTERKEVNYDWIQ